MKPKYRALTRILPTAVSIALSLPFAAQAAIFPDDGAGNATPASSGADTIRADGPVFPNPSPLVTINAGIILTGDLTQTEVLEITAANYTVTNLGSLSGTAGIQGINSTFAFTLTNSGTISGSGALTHGIETLASGTTITNNSTGIISGTDDAIQFIGVGGTVINSGLIDGTTSVLADGIEGFSGVTVTNNNGGTIRGFDNGIDVSSNLNLTNNLGAAVTGTTSEGVFATSDALISNFGTITGGTDGVIVTSGADITNQTTFSIFFPFNPTNGGQIIGLGGNGIFADTDLEVTNELLGLIRGSTNGIVATSTAIITNNAAITGLGGNGITATTDLTLTNQLSGVITGSTSGIVAGNGGTITTNVTNSGTITGLNGNGIQAGDSFVVINNAGATITGTGGSGVQLLEGGVITNAGNISGAIGIQAFGVTTFLLNNTGTITGTVSTAIDGISGVDTLNLDAGSLVNGDILLREGNDSITMTKSGSASSIVIGDIDGGIDTDTLTFVGGMTTAGGFTNRVTGNVTFMQNIIKNSSGTAFIIGDVRADDIAVNAGALYIVGTVYDSNFGESNIVVDVGQIGGTGAWDANITLTNGSIISPGQINLPIATNVADSTGTLTITGDVTLDSSSDYVWNVTPGGTSDLIILSGVGNIFTTNNSDFVISPTNVNAPLLNGSTIVVLTDDVLVGVFDSITVASFPSTTPDTGFFQANQNNPIIADYFSTLNKVNGSTDWQLTIVHDYGQFGSNPNEVAAGDMLDGLVNTATGNLADLLAAMDYSDESYTEDVLAALDPGAILATAAALANGNFQLHRTVEGHNAAVRAGQADCDGATNVWGGFSYDWQDLSTANGEFDQDGDTASFVVGVDFSVSENFRLGVVAEGAQTDWDGGTSLGTEVDSYRFAAYANWGAATGWFVDALIGYNNHSVDQTRGLFSGTESANYDADGWQGLLNVGYAIETTAGTFSPFVGLEWQQMSVDSFGTTIGPIPMSVDGFDIDSFRALAGVRWEGQMSSSIKGYASAAYAFEFEDDATDATVNFGGGSYSATGLEQGDAMLFTAGIRWSMTECTTIDLGYTGEFAVDDGVDTNSANIGVNYSF